MKQNKNSMNIFATQMDRIKLVTGKRTQVELADFLGIRQSSISDAKRRGKIPSGWLVILMRVKHVHPEWILTGKGQCFMPQPIPPDRYETGDEEAERRSYEDALRRLPSRMLADELVRRIAISQEEAFCSKSDGLFINCSEQRAHECLVKTPAASFCSGPYPPQCHFI